MLSRSCLSDADNFRTAQGPGRQPGVGSRPHPLPGTPPRGRMFPPMPAIQREVTGNREPPLWRACPCPPPQGRVATALVGLLFLWQYYVVVCIVEKDNGAWPLTPRCAQLPPLGLASRRHFTPAVDDSMMFVQENSSLDNFFLILQQEVWID